ncbi:MAG: ADP-forming succinate--CoA ligase subunit beta [Thermoplasmata archaeon]
MKLQEYEAIDIFGDYGIPVAKGYVIDSSEEIKDVKEPVVLKSQVTVGKRGKAGGILFADSREEAVEKAKKLFSMTIRGLEVNKILVTKKADIQDEYYVGLVIDREMKRATLIMTSEGGMNIEEVAKAYPEKIIKRPIDPLVGLQSYDAMYMAEAVGLKDETAKQMTKIAMNLYNAFVDYDSELAEINPLVKTPDGLLAIDAVFNIDNNALFRQKFDVKKDQMLSEREKLADEYDLAYVDLDGEIAIIGSGAGLVMATLDSVAEFGSSPACFLDLGGGATAEDTKKALEIVEMKDGVRSIFLNIFGGITKCDEIAKGIIDFGPELPTVIRMMGTNEGEGKRLLTEEGYHVVDGMEEGAKKSVEMKR